MPFDYIKEVISGVPFTVWSQNPLLCFETLVVTETGEILCDRRIAQYRGLVLRITPSIVSGRSHYMTLRGSVATYLNHGTPTAKNLSFKGLVSSIDLLSKDFGVLPNSAKIESLEICVNLVLDYPVSEFLQSIKGHYSILPSYGKNAYHGVEFVRNQYVLKFYDKGKHLGIPQINTLRVELRLNESETLQRYGITYLSDLQQAAKVEPLIKLLVERVQDVILLDSLECDSILDSDKAKLYRWSNPNYWTKDLGGRNFKDRKSRERKAFEILIERYGLDSKKQRLLIDLCSTWALIMQHDEYFLPSKKSDFKNKRTTNYCDTLDIKIKFQSVAKNIYNSLTNSKKSILLKGNKTAKKGSKKEQKGQIVNSRNCAICASDISMKKSRAKVCSTKCGNIKKGKARTEREREKREKENEVLSFIFAESVTSKINFIMLNMGGVIFEKITKRKLCTFTKAEIKRVHLLNFKMGRREYVLTKQRARRLIYHLCNKKALRQE